MPARRAALNTLCCVRSSRWTGERVDERDLVARQCGCVARPRVMHNCFAKAAISGLRNHVAHRSGMIVSFGVAAAAAQRKVDLRFTPESGHVQCY
jgi:hypothetical protein